VGKNCLQGGDGPGLFVEGKCECLVIQLDFCTNVSPPHRDRAVPAPVPSGGPKWRGTTKDGRRLWWWVLRVGIGMTINLPGHPMPVTQHYFNHK